MGGRCTAHEIMKDKFMMNLLCCAELSIFQLLATGNSLAGFLKILFGFVLEYTISVGEAHFCLDPYIQAGQIAVVSAVFKITATTAEIMTAWK